MQMEKRGANRLFASLGKELDDLHYRAGNLMLEAKIDNAGGQWDVADAKHGEVARIQERLAEASRDAGLWERMRIHQTTGASCWAQAGNYVRAFEIYDAVIADPAITEEYRASVVAEREGWKQERAAFLHAHWTKRRHDGIIPHTK